MTIDDDWRERIGVRVMHAMTCTHEGDDFGDRAVCVTCFANTQSIGALIEAEVSEALRQCVETDAPRRKRSEMPTCDRTHCRSLQTGKCLAWCKCRCHAYRVTEGN